VDKGGRALVPLPREAGGAGLTPAEAVRRATALVERSGPAGPKAVAARTSPAPGPLLRLPAAVLDEVDRDLLRRHEARETEPVRLLDWHERPRARDTTQTTR
jgi:hypothetical protein